jgi:hypothetical protein
MSQPTTLEEACQEIRNQLGPEDLEYLKAVWTIESAEVIATRFHHTLGRHIRNEFELWYGSPLAVLLRNTYGVDHPDDMSHLIIVEFLRSFSPTEFERVLED